MRPNPDPAQGDASFTGRVDVKDHNGNPIQGATVYVHAMRDGVASEMIGAGITDSTGYAQANGFISVEPAPTSARVTAFRADAMYTPGTVNTTVNYQNLNYNMPNCTVTLLGGPEVPTPPIDPPPPIPEPKIDCDVCHGSGECQTCHTAHKCPRCEGTGKISIV